MKKIIKAATLILGFAFCLSLCGFIGVKAANGPYEGKDSYAYINIGQEVIGQTEWGDKYCDHYVYLSDNMKAEKDASKDYGEYEMIENKNIKYNKKTNTLTLNNYTGEEITVNMMGDDFKVELVGENTLEKLYVFSDFYGGSLTLTGNGTLNICGGDYFNNEENALYGDSGLRLFCESRTDKTKLTIGKDVTLHVEGDGTFTYPLIAVYGSNETKNGIVLDGVKLKGSYISKSDTEMEDYDRDSDGAYLYICCKNGKEYYYVSNFDYNLDTGEFTSSYDVLKKSDKSLVKSYATIDEMIDDGYEIKNYTVKDYVICGKECTISAKADTKIEKDTVLEKGKLCYGVLTVGTKKKAGTVTVVGFGSWGQVSETVEIPKTIKVDGITYKVTAIEEYAFTFNYGIQKVTIGANVKTIGEGAFAEIETLEEVIIKSKKLKASTVKADAFANTPDTVKVTVPSGKASAYKKILQAKGLSKKATVK